MLCPRGDAESELVQHLPHVVLGPKLIAAIAVGDKIVTGNGDVRDAAGNSLHTLDGQPFGPFDVHLDQGDPVQAQLIGKRVKDRAGTSAPEPPTIEFAK